MPQPPPFNPYGPIHKVQRHLFGQLVSALGALDVDDDDAVAQIAGRIKALAATIHEHTDHEDDLLHPLLDEVAPEVRAQLDGQHAAIDEQFVRVASGLRLLEAAPRDARQAPATELYRDVAFLSGTYAAHMDAEERRSAPALASLGIGRVMAAQTLIVRRIGWTRLCAMLPTTLPVLNPIERIGFVGMLAATFADETSLEEVLYLAGAALPPSAAARLFAAFGIARPTQYAGAAG